MNITNFLNNSLYLLLTQQDNKLNLPNVSLVTVSSQQIEASLLGLVISCLNVNFGRVLFFTSEEINSRYLKLFPQLEVIKIPEINSVFQYSGFIIKELAQYLDTDYCLISQNDGFIVNPQKWDQNFLNYDYIGAPWGQKIQKVKLLSPQENPELEFLTLTKNRVGNGGFSLRSKKLLQIASRLNFEELDLPSLSEDLIICHYFYDCFKERGIKFAPLEMAVKFSFEQSIEEYPKITWQDTFGFHGKNHLASILPHLWAQWAPVFNSDEIIIARLKDDLNLGEYNVIIFPDWWADEEELGLELRELISTLALDRDHEKITLLVDVTNSNQEDVNLFLQGIAINLMMELELDITEYLTISLVNNLTEKDWQLLLAQVNNYLPLKYENKKIIDQLGIQGSNPQ